MAARVDRTAVPDPVAGDDGEITEAEWFQFFAEQRPDVPQERVQQLWDSIRATKANFYTPGK